MPRKGPPPRPAPPSSAQPPLISPRWLAASIGLAIAAAVICAWAALCLLFWQGSWQLLYHPAATISSTPAAAGLTFESIAFDPDNSGQPQLTAWWIPQSPLCPRTILYLHGADGNLSNTVNLAARLHKANLNVFAFDYRGYGQSRFAHPSEIHLLHDADAAIAYLTGTRHIPAASIVLLGTGLGADLALEVASAHSELAGVIIDQPLTNPMQAIFSDPRAGLVPAHALVRDRYDLTTDASDVRIPTLWLESDTGSAGSAQQAPEAYSQIPARKMLVWLPPGSARQSEMDAQLARWLDALGH